MSAVLVIGLMWLVTYPVRLLGLSLGRLRLPPFWLAFLRFVPVGVFAALIVPDVLGSPEWPRRLVAALLGGLLMWRTRHLALGILGGFAAYWAARLLGG
ncbi:hypothetical protein Dcar01_02764 [Deinococcus carri]|uniref:Branched-chain amino acid transport n=1 Tax=Deinococcus carri TaxID=1211323 RepID=A0ABP9WB91_9DEIO